MSKTMDDLEIMELKKKKKQTNTFNNPALFQNLGDKKPGAKGVWVVAFGLILILSAVGYGIYSQLHHRTPSSDVSVMDVPSETTPSASDSVSGQLTSVIVIPDQEIFTPGGVLKPAALQSDEQNFSSQQNLVEPSGSAEDEQSAAATTTSAAPASPLTGKVFTIQLVGYKSSARADQEIQKLKAKGFNAFSVAGTKITSVCLEKFSNRSSALKRLAALKNSLKPYKGAYIRSVTIS